LVMNSVSKDLDSASAEVVKSVIGEIISSGYLSSSYDIYIDQSLDLLKQASQAQIAAPPLDLGILCQRGSLNGYAEQVIQYCEQAGILAPESSYVRDWRGLARALTGDFEGAIDDFQYYVDTQTKAGYGNYGYIKLHERWITDLKDGKNPITPEILKALIEGWLDDLPKG
jgi:hypothetical protein